MNNLSNSVDDVVECPLCMEPLEVDDLNFFPCTCGYQICRFCWHRIRTDENELCPACRKEYPENPADFKPLTQEEMIAFKSQKRQRDQQRKQNTENSKHLANVRVVQKNLVFVVGLPPRLADASILKKHEYFGKYGKIHKVVINPSTTYAGVQGPSASAYVTYVNNTDALRAIQSVNNIMIDGRLIKTSLGTTKYCSHFMKNQQCPKGDCMYLHELGDPEASFTKEEMHQGKHQEYEKRLHDVLIATSAANAAGGLVSAGNASSLSHNSKTIENNKLTGIVPNPSSTTNTSSSTCTAGNSSSSVAGQQKKAWPSLSLSPVNQKDSTSAAGVSNNKCKKERTKQEKNKTEKNSKTKNKTTNTNIVQLSKEIIDVTVKVPISTLSQVLDCSLNNDLAEQTTKFKVDKTKDRHPTSLSNRSNERKEVDTSTAKENDIRESDKTTMQRPTTSPNLESINGPSSNMMDNDSSCSSNSSSSCLMTTSDNTSTINQSVSGNSSISLQESLLLDECTQPPGKSELNDVGDNNMGNSSNGFLHEEHAKSPAKSDLNDISDHNIENALLSDGCSKSFGYVDNVISDKNIGQKHNLNYDNNMDNVVLLNASENNRLTSSNIEKRIFSETSLGENKNEDIFAPTISNLNLFDESSYFSSPPGVLQKSMLMRNKHSEEVIPNQLNSGTMPNLPDLIIGIDAYQNNTNDWEEAFKNVMLRSNEQTEDKLQQQSLHQQQPHHHHQITHQEDLHRIQEIQKRNSFLNSFSLSQLNGPQNKYTLSNSYLMGSDLNSQSNFLPQQHQLLQQQSNQNPNENVLQNSLFGTNMSKFFDFHKNQQQKLHQHCGQNGSNNVNGSINENLHMMPLLDSNRLNSQLMEQSILTTQQQHQKQKVFGKMDQMLSHHQQQQPHSNSSAQSQQNQFMQNSNADDDLGFDPFIETQKALAELIENEEEQQILNTATSSQLIPHKQANNQPQPQPQQQQMINYMQRARMPPPGFNHVNNYGGYGAAPRLENNSKIMPFMNLSGNYSGLNCQPNQQHQHQQQLQIPNNAWSTRLGNFQQQINDQQVRQMKSNPLQNDVNQKGYTGNDWTAMDPAILSFRQFSFPQQTKITPHLQPQQQQQDMFLQQLAQQQQPGYNSQSQHIGGNASISNTIINSQQSSEAHVNANVQGMLEYLKTRQFF